MPLTHCALRLPDDLRRRIGRLEGLPSRPETTRRASVEGVEALDEAGVDPGWVLASGSESGPVDAWSLIAGRPSWPSASPEGGEALDRLWRHAVAVACAARRVGLEAGDPDPEALARAGLLHNLGLWALAAIDPDRLAELLAIDEPTARRDRERRLLGTDAADLGRSLAERWGAGRLLADASWLHADPAGDLDACAGEPGRIALIRSACRWAERTPWALGPVGIGSGRADDPRVRRLVAEVQVRCPGRFAGATSPLEERLIRDNALLRSEVDRLRESQASQALLIGTLAATGDSDDLDDPVPPRQAAGADVDPTTLEAARDAWQALRRERARLADRLGVAREALRRRAEDEGRARQADRLEALAEFAAGAGHELNNPLAVIVGRAQLLLGRARDADADRSLRAIIAQAQRASRILRDLMYVARPPAPRPRPCQPDEIVRACLADLRDEAEARGVRLIFEPGNEGGPSLRWADPDALRHLAEILARNALEATPPGGTVRISTDGGAGPLQWTVRDDGPGLGPVEARHLFDPFFCGRQAGRGLGLGLPRAARFVGRSGGRIRWRSEPGRGTVVHLHLPLSGPPAPAPQDGPDPGRAR